jgi:hypothetical protein
MRTTISATGCLRITPETELEAYALMQWWSDYIDANSHNSSLHVDLTRDDAGVHIPLSDYSPYIV